MRPSRGFSSIPGELLCAIFQLILVNQDQDKTRCAITLSRINRKCRKAVVTTPTFWNTLDSDLAPELSRISLERSSQSDLSLRIGEHLSRLDTFMELIKPEIGRLSCITFYDIKGWKKFILFFKNFSMTALRKLRISESGSLKEVFTFKAFETLHMPNLTCYEGPGLNFGNNISWATKLDRISLYAFFAFFDTLKTLDSCRYLELRFPHQEFCTHRDDNLAELEIYNTSSEEDRLAGLPPRRPIRKSYNREDESETEHWRVIYHRDSGEEDEDNSEDYDSGEENSGEESGEDATEENIREGLGDATQAEEDFIRENDGEEGYVHSRKAVESKPSAPMLRHLVLEIQCHAQLRYAEDLIYSGRLPLHQITTLKIVLQTNARDETFQNMFCVADFNNLESFEVIYAEEGESPASFSLRGMPVLEDLFIEGTTGFTTIEGYMFDAKALTAVRRIKLWDCDIHDESIVTLAKVLADPLRLQSFELLRLHGCRLSPSTLQRLRSILPVRKFDFVI